MLMCVVIVVIMQLKNFINKRMLCVLLVIERVVANSSITYDCDRKDINMSCFFNYIYANNMVFYRHSSNKY